MAFPSLILLIPPSDNWIIIIILLSSPLTHSYNCACRFSSAGTGIEIDSPPHKPSAAPVSRGNFQDSDLLTTLVATRIPSVYWRWRCSANRAPGELYTWRGRPARRPNFFLSFTRAERHRHGDLIFFRALHVLSDTGTETWFFFELYTCWATPARRPDFFLTIFSWTGRPGRSPDFFLTIFSWTGRPGRRPDFFLTIFFFHRDLIFLEVLKKLLWRRRRRPGAELFAVCQRISINSSTQIFSSTYVRSPKFNFKFFTKWQFGFVGLDSLNCSILSLLLT